MSFNTALLRALNFTPLGFETQENSPWPFPQTSLNFTPLGFETNSRHNENIDSSR